MSDESRRQREVLAEPVTFKIWREVLASGPMTGTQISRAVREVTQGVASHLRYMEEVGLVRKIGDGASVRTQTWEAVDVRLDWDSEDTPRDQILLRMFERSVHEYRSYMSRRWMSQKHAGLWGDEWIAAELNHDYRLELNADQLDHLYRDLSAVIERWKSEAPGAGAEQVVVTLAGHPTRGDVGE